MVFCFIAGGIYIASSIQSVTLNLGRVVSFHQVEFLREELEHNIKAVQTDLLLQGSPHASSFDHSVALIETLEDSADICLSCHHSEKTTHRLGEFVKAIEHYMTLLSRSLTMQANNVRLENARMEAFSQGENLLQDIKTLSTASAGKISERITKIQGDIKATNYFLMACLVLGPVAIVIMAGLFLKRFTGSIDTLVHAAQVLERGDLDYRIAQPLKGEFHTLAGAFNGMAASIKDEQQKFETAHKSYRTLFETAGEAIMISRLDEPPGLILSANRAASDLYGYSIDELQTMNLVHLVPDGQEQEFLEQIRKAGDSGEWLHRRIQRKKKDGALIDVALSMGPMQQGEQKHLLTFCRDITEQLRAEEEMQRSNQMALVGQMSAGLAHEIKNPLAGIKISLDVLAEDLELKPEDKELFGKIGNEIGRMEKLLKSLLNYGRPPQPQFDLFDMNRLLANTLGNVEAVAYGKPELTVHFKKELATDLPRVEADSAQMQQVFLNILLNAVDALETEGTITIATDREDENSIRIRISDSGKGISEAALEKIFNPFFTTKSKGTGLGLSICKRLIEQHGGRIDVESQKERGTSFIIILPLIQKIGGLAA